MTTDSIISKVWSFCTILKDDGVIRDTADAATRIPDEEQAQWKMLSAVQPCSPAKDAYDMYPLW